MAENPNVNSIASRPSYSEALKPVSGWKTTTVKVLSFLTGASGALNIGLGVAGLISGRSVQIGSIRLVGGSLGLGIAALQYSSADGAARARNFVKLQEQLNGASTAQGRT